MNLIRCWELKMQFISYFLFLLIFFTSISVAQIAGRDVETQVVDITNSITGRTWMDRNLGANRAATSSDDEEAYGHLYQWGRGADGHQLRTSSTTSVLSNSDGPEHGEFIISYDWNRTQNDDLWQGLSGTNNPCPVAYRLPTEAEWEAERESWSTNDAAGAFGSALKLPMAGDRRINGEIFNEGALGDYKSSTSDGASSRSLFFYSSYATMSTNYRSLGSSVRCIKN
jgi:uncharacterized protein (TIGR02145 family)